MSILLRKYSVLYKGSSKSIDAEAELTAMLNEQMVTEIVTEMVGEIDR